MMNNELLTVTEVADKLRTTPNTIYRWLRAGKLPGVKIGKEWRIKSGVLEAKLSDSHLPGEISYLDKLNCRHDHIMAVTSSASEVYDLEAEFFKRGLREGRRLFKGCWWQNREEVRRELSVRGLSVDELEKRNMLAIVDLADSFNRYGEKGPVQVWLEEANRSLAMGYETMWGSGSPNLFSCGEDISKLLDFEHSLDQSMEKAPIVGICPYVFNMETQDCFNYFIHLMNHHKGVLFYSTGPATFFRRELAHL